MLEQVDELFAKEVLRDFPQVRAECHQFLAQLLALSRQGHLCMPMNEIAKTLPEPLFGTVLKKSGEKIYLKYNWEVENKFIKSLKRLLNSHPDIRVSQECLEGHLAGSLLNREQKNAVHLSTKNRLTLICGGPGTGKTFTANTILSLHEGKKIAACAPTGKASANLRRNLKQPHVTCKTLSALLKGDFLPFDLVLVDEASMIDAPTMAKLLACLKEGSQLILLGDPHQLPPVESGNFFADLVSLIPDHVAPLATSLRTDLKEILSLAETIKKGEKIGMHPLPKESELLHMIFARHRLDKNLTAEELFATFRQFRLLTPLKRGPFGTCKLNQKCLQLHKRAEQTPLIPIMITENDEELRLYNGDFALLDEQKKEILLEDGRTFSSLLAPRFEPSYFLSVHKSQGSEYDEVAVILPPGSETFGREMLYTAVTRAKRKIEIFGSAEIGAQVIEKKFVRMSGLAHDDFFASQRAPEATPAKRNSQDFKD